MAVRSAKAEWRGTLKEGSGHLASESGALDTPYDFPSRFQEGERTNPEELVGAAHAGCYSMALANGLAEAGHEPELIETEARVHLEKGSSGFAISRIELKTRARVPGLDEETFRKHAEEAKVGCPVSKALEAVEISLDAGLSS